MNVSTTETMTAPPMEVPLAPNNLPATVDQVRELRRTEPIAQARAYPAKIARGILAITREIGHIAKRGENTFQRYKYAKWEDVVEALSPLLAEHGLIMVQAEKSRHLIEDNDKGSTLSVVYGFSFVSEDGELWPEVEWTALARLRDQKGVTDDKAATKCHTQAEKYFCMKQFKIRTEEDDGIGQGRRTLPKKDAREIHTKLQAEIDQQQSMGDLKQWGADNSDRINVLPSDWQDILRLRYQERLVELRQHPLKEQSADVAEHDDDGVIWDDPPDGTVAEQSSKWDALPPVQQAGIRCGDPMFWKFATEHMGKEIGSSVEAAGYVRTICNIKSRALLSTDVAALAKWRDIDAKFLAWKHADHPSPAPPPTSPPAPPQASGVGGNGEDARILQFDDALMEAAEHGTLRLQQVWSGIAPADQKVLKAALDRRHKPNAAKVDERATP